MGMFMKNHFVICLATLLPLTLVACEPGAPEAEQTGQIGAAATLQMVQGIEIPDQALTLNKIPAMDPQRLTLGTAEPLSAIPPQVVQHDLPYSAAFDCSGTDWNSSISSAPNVVIAHDEGDCYLNVKGTLTGKNHLMATVTSPTIDARGTSTLRLAFDEMGSCNSKPGWCELRVSVHSEKYGMWAQVDAFRVEWNQQTFGWGRSEIDLSPYANDVIQLRFEMELDSVVYAAADWGIADLVLSTQ
ncbi:MAG: hypothetical protein ACI9WU_004871 [Myxococcota bacterium]|jgi:hypothetical protein